MEAPSSDSDLKDIRSRISEEIVLLAYADAEKGNLSEAIRKYGFAVEKDSPNAEAYRYRALARIKLNDLEAALADLRQGIKADPRSLQAYRDIDWILAHKRDWKSIIGYWNAFLALEPGNAVGYFERSGTYFHLGDMDAGKRDAQRHAARATKRHARWPKIISESDSPLAAGSPACCRRFETIRALGASNSSGCFNRSGLDRRLPLGESNVPNFRRRYRDRRTHGLQQ